MRQVAGGWHPRGTLHGDSTRRHVPRGASNPVSCDPGRAPGLSGTEEEWHPRVYGCRDEVEEGGTWNILLFHTNILTCGMNSTARLAPIDAGQCISQDILHPRYVNDLKVKFAQCL